MIIAILKRYPSLLEAVEDPSLRKKPGVYLLRCRECGHVLYIGQAADLRARLAGHAFVSPYGAVDIVYGDVLLPGARDRFCPHLREARKQPRPEVVRFLLAEIEIIYEAIQRERREAELFGRFPSAYGNRARIWASTAADFVTYYLQKGAGYLVGFAAGRGSNTPADRKGDDRIVHSAGDLVAFLGHRTFLDLTDLETRIERAEPDEMGQLAAQKRIQHERRCRDRLREAVVGWRSAWRLSRRNARTSRGRRCSLGPLIYRRTPGAIREQVFPIPLEGRGTLTAPEGELWASFKVRRRRARLEGDIGRGGDAAQHRVPLQSEPAERGDLPGHVLVQRHRQPHPSRRFRATPWIRCAS